MAAESLDEWRTAMWGAEDTARVLSAALTHMNANLAAAGAGRTQTALTGRWPGWADEIADEGKRIAGRWNPRFSDQAGGLAAAGGAGEVYEDKEAATPGRL
jgi:hypothetical protein